MVLVTRMTSSAPGYPIVCFSFFTVFDRDDVLIRLFRLEVEPVRLKLIRSPFCPSDDEGKDVERDDPVEEVASRGRRLKKRAQNDLRGCWT